MNARLERPTRDLSANRGLVEHSFDDMTVWVVTLDSGDYFFGVYSSEEKAKDAITIYNEDKEDLDFAVTPFKMNAAFRLPHFPLS